MFLISVVLFVGLTTIFANPFYPNINRGNSRLLPQQESSTTRANQDYSPSMPQLSMEGNHQMYPMPQHPMMPPPMMPPPMMPPPMMQGFQPPLPFNPINLQQLSLLLMSSYARAMALTQLINMQNRYQLYQPNQYSDPAVNNYSPMPAPLPYAQQPLVDLQNNLQNEMFQQQEQHEEPQQQQESQQQEKESQQQQESQQEEESRQQAESQQRAESQQQEILEKRKIQRQFDMEIERRERLMKRKAEETDLENKQKEIERILRDEEEMKRQEEETKKQILEEEQKEMEQKEKDLKLRQEEELRFQKNEEKMKQNQEKKKRNQEKMKQNQENQKPKGRVTRGQRTQINANKKY